jgi:hypothetical protein
LQAAEGESETRPVAAEEPVVAAEGASA